MCMHASGLCSMQANRSVNTDAQVRPAAARPLFLGAGYLQRYAAGVAARSLQ